MTRIHDMGGRFGDGPIPLKKIDGKVVDDEPVFKTDWHAKAFAITVASASVGKWSIDKSRFFRESLPPKDYAKFDYYEKWSSALINLLVERGLINKNDLIEITKKAKEDNLEVSQVTDEHQDVLKAKDVAITLGRGGPSAREVLHSPKFKVGQEVRTINYSPNKNMIGGHTRLPIYARGKKGKVILHHKGHVLPDASAHDLGDSPEHLYTVEFLSTELWGDKDGNQKDSICIDLWESYLI